MAVSRLNLNNATSLDPTKRLNPQENSLNRH
jgi:hypothetical protein